MYKSGFRIRHFLTGGSRYFKTDPPKDTIKFKILKREIINNAYNDRIP